jgi:phytoene dehydrogenase-like protein
MPGNVSYDAVVVGAGPNGLAAAIRLAQAKLSVLVLEANETVGGGARSAELTLPGFFHDVCSAIHPLGLGSPFFRSLPLEHYGLHWLQPPLPLAHPLDGNHAAILARSVPETAAALGASRRSYEQLMQPLVEHWEILAQEFLQPLIHFPKHPLRLARFGLKALRSAASLARSHFEDKAAQALFAGLAGHSFLPLEACGSAAFGLVLGMLGHSVGWPLPRGGSQEIANALAAHLRMLGGEIATRTKVETIDQLPLSHVVMLDVTPLQLLLIAGHKLPSSYSSRLGRYRYGPGVFKLDYALSRSIPWRAEACSRSATVHLGGTLEEIAQSEREVARGRHAESPFIILTQPSLFDPTRAPSGKHTAWAYCHVPNGSAIDMTDAMERQIERFAPGFRDCILARHTTNCAEFERRNANLVGGDISGGASDLWQLVARPVLSRVPYRLPVPGLYLCSSSTPPGGGVHGMCGFHAAEAALRDCFRDRM